VLEGLKRRLLAPEPFEAFARAYQEERAALARAAAADRVALEGRLAAVEREIAAIVRAVEDGLYQPAMKERLAALEAEKGGLAAELAERPCATPVALHPNLPALYRRKVEELERLLGDPELGAEAAGAIRSWVTRVVLTPGADGGMEAVLEGDLARILSICEGAAAAASAQSKTARLGGGGRSAGVLQSQVSVVAGAGFEPAAFRL
jgi:site-specific DNA recombinase